MASFGVEYIDSFANARATGRFGGGEDLSSPYYIATWFGEAMFQAGHQRTFHANLASRSAICAMCRPAATIALTASICG